MNVKENITLIKGFELRKDGHLWCMNYDFGLENEIVGKTFNLNIDESEIELCKKGFHACDCIGKVNVFYKVSNLKNVFCEIKVDKAFFEDTEKFVFSKFSVTEKLIIGDSNTGDSNTGNRNTGDSNTGDWNTGDSNTGDWNTGYWNTGDSNTGDSNTGNWNTGDSNTGYRNTGDSNTGNRNTGDRNTGYRNICNYSCDAFSIETPTIKCFGKDTGMAHEEFYHKYIEIIKSEPTMELLSRLPNFTKERGEEYMRKYNELKKNVQPL